MDALIEIEPLSAAAFAPFGDVIEATGAHFPINGGRCERYHDLARMAFAGEDGRAGISIARSRPVALPYRLDLVERHPLGSQAFVPLSDDPFLVVVAPDRAGLPGRPRAFLTEAGQGVNYLRDTWHGVLTPLGRPGDFLVIDRVGGGENLVEHAFERPFTVVLPQAG